METLSPLNMIKEDHEKVKTMFEEYESMGYEKKKVQADKIAEELVIHAEMEEKIFYPRIRGISEEGTDLVEESIGEHDEMKSHIGELYNVESEEDLDAHIEDLKDAVEHHTAEEENEMFQLAEENLYDDFTELAAEMEAFKLKEKGASLLGDFKRKISG